MYDNKPRYLLYGSKGYGLWDLSDDSLAYIFIQGQRWYTVRGCFYSRMFKDPNHREYIRRERDLEKIELYIEKHKKDIRSDWDKIKLPMMEMILFNKFTNDKRARRALRKTRSKILMYDANDLYWGSALIWDGGKIWRTVGLNWHGKILMKIREKLNN